MDINKTKIPEIVENKFRKTKGFGCDLRVYRWFASNELALNKTGKAQKSPIKILIGKLNSLIKGRVNIIMKPEKTKALINNMYNILPHNLGKLDLYSKKLLAKCMCNPKVYTDKAIATYEEIKPQTP